MKNKNLIDKKEQLQEATEELQLNQPITVKFLLSFTIPTILSFVIQSAFGIIDGVFASRGISVEALSAVNFVMPFISFTMAIASMLSMGGCALVANKKGKGLLQEARENFTLLTVVTFVSSLIIMVFSWVLREPLLHFLGTDAHVFDLTLEYLQPIILMMPFFIAGMFMIQFLIAEGRPVLGMIVSVSGAAVSTSIGTILSANLLVRIYVPAGTEMYAMTVRGLRIVATGYLFMGFNVFATAWFTAFNDGLVSGVMSFMRTIVFTLILLVTLPRAWDLTGVWIALPIAEMLSIILTIFFLVKMRKKYNYSGFQATLVKGEKMILAKRV